MTAALGNYQLLGDSHLLTPNEPNAFAVNYYLKAKLAGPVKVTVITLEGETLAEFDGKNEAGFNTAAWDMRPRRPGRKPAPGADPGFGGPRLVAPGEYVITLEAAGTKLVKKAVVRYRQGWTVGPTPVIIR